MQRLRILWLGMACLALAWPAGAQAPAPVSDQAALALTAAAAELKADASAVQAPSTSDDVLRAELAAIPSIQARLARVLGDITPRLRDADARLAQLGAAQPGEPAETSAERSSLASARRAMDAEVRQANLLTVEAAQTSAAISNQLRTNFDSRLWVQSRSIFDPELASSVGDNVSREGLRLAAVVDDQTRRTARAATGFGSAAILVLAAVAAFASLVPLRLLLNRLAYRRAPVAGLDSRLHRSALALWLVLVAGLTPWLAGLSLRAGFVGGGGLNADFDAVLGVVIRVAVVIGLIEGIGRAVLSPAKPSWRLAPIPDRLAARLAPFPGLIAAAAGLALLVSGMDAILGANLVGAVAGERLTVLVEILAVGAALVTVMRGGAAPAGRDSESDEQHARGARLPWVIAALAAWLALIVAFAAMVSGYLALAGFLMRESIWIAVVLAMLVLSLTFVDDLFPALLSVRAAPGRVLRHAVGLTEDTLEHIAVLLSGLCRIGLLLFAWAAIVLPYGTSAGDIIARLTSTQAQFRFGQVTISPGAVIGGIGLFLVGLLATRAVRRWLEVRYLPKTHMDLGARTSLAALFSYVGIAIALMLAFAYLGLSFSQITLLASALSVGIGFGLQSIIGNFVSGLILLVERPVKVGDMIAIGDLEGDVRAINIRATQIDMADGSKLIVPNSELISKTVRNVTHAAATGRVRIVLHLGGAVDPAAVRDLLLERLGAHAKVLTAPAPAVYFTDAGGGGLEFTAIAYVPSPRDAFAAKSDLLFEIVPALKDKGFIA